MKNSLIKKFQPNKAVSAKYLMTGLALLFSFSLFAQGATTPPAEDTTWLFSNGLFDALLGVILLLLIFIAVLGGVLINVARFSAFKKEVGNGKTLGVIALIVLLSATHSASAQAVAATAAAAAPPSVDYMGLGAGMFYLMLAFIAMEIVIIIVMFNSIQVLLKREIAASEIAEGPTFIDRISAAVPVANEEEILMDHDYDGIKELDNDLPPWWKYGFYITIVFAFIYMFIFHISKTGDLQGAAYEKAMETARIAKEEFQKKDANSVTENNVKMLTDKDRLAAGKETFLANCAVCHGKLGEGIVGPNLTDDYWIHGGSIKNLFHTITFGWPDKGMKSWQADFPPSKINELASYVKSLHGTNPPNGKAPQGEIYKEEGPAVDSAVKTDSTKAATPAVDSTKKEGSKKK